MTYVTRIATIEDIPYITQIYNEGIEDNRATLETKLKSVDKMNDWFLNRNDRYKVVVIQDENSNVIGWASLNLFNSRCSYSGVADLSIYIKRSMRGNGIGKVLLNYLFEIAKEQEFYKIVLHTLSINSAGKKLYLSLGFREVGTYINQGILNGKWIDVTIMEKHLINTLE